jgi:hypothetical protein
LNWDGTGFIAKFERQVSFAQVFAARPGIRGTQGYGIHDVCCIGRQSRRLIQINVEEKVDRLEKVLT